MRQWLLGRHPEKEALLGKYLVRDLSIVDFHSDRLPPCCPQQQIRSCLQLHLEMEHSLYDLPAPTDLQ